MWTNYEVEADEFLSGMSLREKQFLVQELKADLEDVFDVVPEGVKPRALSSDVMIDVDDVIEGLSEDDALCVYKKIKKNISADEVESSWQAPKGLTNTEESLAVILNSIWQNRTNLDPSHIQKLQNFANGN